MRAEIIAIGSEILLGQSIDTNGPWIANKLTEIGIDCHFKTVVGDNIKNIVDTLNLSLTRADVVLCTGGLGPTQDDISRDALAKVLGVPLVFDETLAKAIEDKFKSRNRKMSDNNLRQAYYPQGASILDVHPGTAPGLHAIKENKHLFLMPGVPTEMELMMEESVLPFLLSLLPNPKRIFTKTIRCWGLPESDIAEKLSHINDELDHKSNPKLSFLASGIEGIQVRFSSKNHTAEEAESIIKPYFEEAKSILNHYVFGYDNDSMELAIEHLMTEHNLTLSLYETFSNGFVTTRLNEFSDTEQYFKGSIVHSNRHHPNMKEALKKLQAYYSSDIALTVTGEALDKNNLKLTLYLYHNDQLQVKTITMPYFNHHQVISFSVINLLNMLRRYLQAL